MAKWPFSRVHLGCGRCVAIAGPHIQLLDASSGDILHSRRAASTVSCSAIDEKYAYLVTTGDDKKLNVWELNGLELKSSRELPKKATVVQLSPDGQTILVADKFGDVFGYPLIPSPEDTVPPPARTAPEPRKRDSVASHENMHGILVLGHASIITSFLLSHDGRYIITADRDEHIRVSRYPQGYVIERYCLGHELFVSALCLPAFEPSSLVSGGGDTSLRVWDWMSGELVCQVPVVEAVKPFLRVRESRPSWHRGGATGRGHKVRGRKKNEKEKETPEETISVVEPSAGDMAEVTSEELVFALAKVEALDLDGERILVFSAIGGSALFYCSYPSPTSDIPAVRQVEFSRPVLDFVVRQDGRVLVSLDTTWILPGGGDDHEANPIVLVEWKPGGFEVTVETSLLVASLNGAAYLDASVSEIASLDLYSELALLPKHPDGQEDGEGAGGEQDSDMRPETPESSQGDGGKQSARVAGRLKTKQALLRKQDLDKGGSSQSASGDEREVKKIKLGEV